MNCIHYEGKYIIDKFYPILDGKGKCSKWMKAKPINPKKTKKNKD
jgi:hypothetical protein